MTAEAMEETKKRARRWLWISGLSMAYCAVRLAFTGELQFVLCGVPNVTCFCLWLWEYDKLQHIEVES